jgi:probable HAF family extracellular repeat protein
MRLVTSLALAVALGAPSVSFAQYFQRLLPGTFSRGYALSSDGKAVAGVYSPGGGQLEAFRWTPSASGEALGDLPGGANSSFGFGISGTGGRVVGQSSSSGGLEAFRTIDGPMVGLGDLPGGLFESSANAVDDLGAVVVGSSQSSSGREAFILFDSGGNTLQGIGDLPGGAFDSAAFGVSGSGGIVVGYGTSSNGREAFRWNLFQGFTPLGDLTGGAFDSTAYDISDGGVVVGRGRSAAGDEAFRWTSTGGMVGLGDLPGGLFGSIARSVSGDGSVVVGQGKSALGDEAFVWREGQGMTSVREALGAAMPSGWTLTSAESVSRDGRSVAGWGTDPNGDEQAWYAYLDDDVYWMGPSSGDWGDRANWTGIRLPSQSLGAVVQGSAPVAVTVPTGGPNAEARYLELGSTTPGAAPVSLVVLPGVFEPANLFISFGVIVRPNATASLAGGAGIQAGVVANYGLFSGSGVVQIGDFNNLGGAVLRTQSTETMRLENDLGSTGIVEVRGAPGEPATLEVLGATFSGEDAGVGPGRGRFDLEHAVTRFVGGLTNRGDFNVNAGVVDVYGGVLSDATGELNVASGATARFHGGVSNYAVSQIDGVAEFLGPYDGFGLGGPGTARFASVVQPDGAGTLPASFGGAVELQGGASLLMTITGTAPATQVDKLQVAGALTLSGALTVTLQGYTPNPGDSFDLFDAASIAGAFSQTNLPALVGASWDGSLLATTGLLSVVSGAAGDFNADGVFTAADYDVWVANYGAIGATPSQGDANGDGAVDAADYTVWRDAQVGVAASASGRAVPEPAAAALVALASAAALRHRRA